VREISWKPATIAVAERVDGQACALVIRDIGEETTIPMTRSDAHRIGAELIAAAALTQFELEELASLDAAYDARTDHLHEHGRDYPHRERFG